MALCPSLALQLVSSIVLHYHSETLVFTSQEVESVIIVRKTNTS